MNKELKEQAHKEFDERFCSFTLSADERCNECVHKTFDGSSVADYCGSADEYIKSFIDSLIDKTVQMTEERIVEYVTNPTRNGISSMFQLEGDEKYVNANQLISLITNKSDINN